MKRLFSKTFFVLMAAVAVSAFGATPASASAAGVAGLTGTISPDPIAAAAAQAPSTTPFGVSTSQTGTAAGVIGTTPATCTVNLTTTGTTNLVTGTGSGGFSCNGSYATGGNFSVSCTVTYNQIGGVIQVSGSCTGPAGPSLSATCGIQVATNRIVTECEFTL